MILIQENRSFDPYFGMFPGVRGFGDSKGTQRFLQKGQDGATVQPFHFADRLHVATSPTTGRPSTRPGTAGSMDRSSPPTRTTRAAAAAADETMGYYDKSDIPLYYALADKFTICDRYHCSVIGPTDPNRLMSMSAWLDPHGTHGGPLVETAGPAASTQQLQLDDDARDAEPQGRQLEGLHRPGRAAPSTACSAISSSSRPGPLYDRGLAPTYPTDFLSDLSLGKLPQVSWLTPGIFDSEHPGFSSPQRRRAGRGAR